MYFLQIDKTSTKSGHFFILIRASGLPKVVSLCIADTYSKVPSRPIYVKLLFFSWLFSYRLQFLDTQGKWHDLDDTMYENVVN